MTDGAGAHGSELAGEVIGSYRLIRQLGAGGMAVVYEGEHLLMGRRAAVKLLHPEVSGKESVVERFFFEARAASSIRHDGIIEVYDFGYHDGRAFLVMELLEGESLQERLRRDSSIPPGEAIQIAAAVASSLAAAHRAGVIHRDLKPANVFLRDDGRVCLLDFGIAKLISNEAWSTTKTATNVIVGTPLYMSPEQCRGGTVEIDERADLYSLGCLLYRMVIGRAPFTGQGGGEVIAHHLFAQPTPLTVLSPDVDRSLNEVVMRLLEKAPDNRYQSANDVIAALERCGGGGGRLNLAQPSFDGALPRTLEAQTPAISTSAAETIAPRRSWVWPVAASLLVASIGAAIAVTQVGGSDPEPTTPSATQVAASAVDAAAVTGTADAMARPVELSITSRPAGAAVVDELGEALGDTPLTITLASTAATRRLELHLEGYMLRAVVLPGDASSVVDLDLEPIAIAEAPRGSKKSGRETSGAKSAKESKKSDGADGGKASGSGKPGDKTKPIDKPIRDGSLDPFQKKR